MTWFPVSFCDVPSCIYALVPHYHCDHENCSHVHVQHLVHALGCCGSIDSGGRYSPDYYHDESCCSGVYEFIYHVHCKVPGCTTTTMHHHCKQKNNCTIDPSKHHVHCSDDNCEWVTYGYTYDYNQYIGHGHCHHPNCAITVKHSHDCEEPGCSYIYDHSHCNICHALIPGQMYHKHCQVTNCDVLMQHEHCDKCNKPSFPGIEHITCNICNDCIINNDHNHCEICDVRVNIDTYHAHCSISECNNTAYHQHCRYGCLETDRHQHCSKCKQIKEKGKKHNCNVKII